MNTKTKKVSIPTRFNYNASIRRIICARSSFQFQQGSIITREADNDPNFFGVSIPTRFNYNNIRYFIDGAIAEFQFQQGSIITHQREIDRDD